MKKLLFLFFIMPAFLFGQQQDPNVLSFEEYLAFVKKYHPIAVQANVHLSRGEAQLLRARGGFDPKLEVDYATKQFKGTEYYDILNTTFKIPTWYGLEVKGGFEQNDGVYLNPERTVPERGLFSAGVSLSAGGIFMNERMAAVRGARAFRNQTRAERDLMLNQVLYEASVAYFNWFRVHNEVKVYQEFLENAERRFQGIKTNARIGEIPAIDTVEAKISLQDRRLRLEQAQVNLMKQRLNVSNYLWLENTVPVELQPNMVPQQELVEEVDEVLELPESLASEISLENHPKLESLEFKRDALEIERRLKANRLLPQLNLDYNFITPEPEAMANFNTTNYKAGLSLRFPLFLRKERGDLRLSELKLRDAEMDIRLNERTLENKIRAIQQELEAYEDQNDLISEMVQNYIILLAAEERKMSFGESSLFLINSRESKLIEAQLKQNEILLKILDAKARLFQNRGINPELP